MTRRLATISVQLTVLQDALCLPVGYELLSASYDQTSQEIKFLITAESLPETPEGDPLPTLEVWHQVDTLPYHPEYRRVSSSVKVRG